MPNLVKYVSEYFLGAETINKIRNDYRKYTLVMTKDDQLVKRFSSSTRESLVDLVLGKGVPTLIDIASVAFYLATDKPNYGVLLGESFRFAYHLLRAYDRKTKNLRDDVRYVSQKMQKIADELQKPNDRITY